MATYYSVDPLSVYQPKNTVVRTATAKLPTVAVPTIKSWFGSSAVSSNVSTPSQNTSSNKSRSVTKKLPTLTTRSLTPTTGGGTTASGQSSPNVQSPTAGVPIEVRRSLLGNLATTVQNAQAKLAKENMNSPWMASIPSVGQQQAAQVELPAPKTITPTVQQQGFLASIPSVAQAQAKNAMFGTPLPVEYGSPDNKDPWKLNPPREEPWTAIPYHTVSDPNGWGFNYSGALDPTITRDIDLSDPNRNIYGLDENRILYWEGTPDNQAYAQYLGQWDKDQWVNTVMSMLSNGDGSAGTTADGSVGLFGEGYTIADVIRYVAWRGALEDESGTPYTIGNVVDENGNVDVTKLNDVLSKFYDYIAISPQETVSSSGGGSSYDGGGYYSSGGGGGGEETAKVTWEKFDSGITDHPAWWSALKPSSLTSESQYMAYMNMLIPFLSPEDQLSVAAALYQLDPVTFAQYAPEKLGSVSGSVSEDALLKYGSASHAAQALAALEKLRSVMGKGVGDMGQGYNFLKSVLGTMKSYGSKGSNYQTRTQYEQLLGALDPMLSGASGGETGAYSSIAKMLAQPYFSGGQLRSVSKDDSGNYVFGSPIYTLY